MSKSKRYQDQAAKIDHNKHYPLSEAVEVLKSLESPKFDETVELAFNLGINPRQSDQNIRGAFTLPHGTGKQQRVVAVADGNAAEAAREAGADLVGHEEVIEKIKGGWLDFDVLVATPGAMKDLRALGRMLGPRGLMPNPKTGTLTEDTGTAVKEAKAGRVEYRTDRGGCVHVPIGKRSFSAEALMENAETVIQHISNARPTSLKGNYFCGIAISGTMTPSLKVDLKTVTKA